MLEFEQNTDGSVIKEVSEATFMQDVVEASKERPVIVDFWAPWCGPCKTLGPQLEEAVKATNGAVTMAKVNVDENQMIAGQMQVQSIPTVFAFSNGQPVDGFQGAVSASEIKAFVDRVVAANGVEVESGLDNAVASAEQMLNEGDFEAAIETFSAILEEDANNLKSYILIDPNTNYVIAESNSDGQIEPASMTKVMTGYIVADQIEQGMISNDDNVLISRKAWKMEGSRMFIEVGKRVSVKDLLKGLVIQSGNDAAVALAEYVAGSEQIFVDVMNEYASVLGLRNTLFQNSTGLPDADHFTSVRDPVSYTHLTLPTILLV